MRYKTNGNEREEVAAVPRKNAIITTIDPLTDGRWDAFVSNHPLGWVCHLSGWVEVLCKSFKHMNAHYFVLTNGDEIKAALPVFEVRSWLTGNRLVSIPFATLSDPLVSSKEELDQLLSAVINFSGGRNIEIRTLASSTYFDKADSSLIMHYKYHYLPLDRTPEELMKSFHRTCVRQRIARAKDSGIRVEEGMVASGLGDFYRLHLTSRKRLALPPQPYVFFESLFDVLRPRGLVSLLLAKLEGKTVGALILLRFNGRVSAEFAVYDERYHNISPLHGLFWHAIKSAHEDGYRTFDFGRTSEINCSLIDFKSRWGTKVEDMPEFHYPLPAKQRKATVREETVAYKLMRKVCHNAPAFAFPLIGKFCYRHLG